MSPFLNIRFNLQYLITLLLKRKAFLTLWSHIHDFYTLDTLLQLSNDSTYP